MIIIKIEKVVYDSEDNCSYVMDRDKCSWLDSGVCQLFRVNLERDRDRFLFVKCDQCKNAYKKATE